MFRNGVSPRPKQPLNFLMTSAGMGDNLCALVPIEYVLNHVPYIQPLVWCPDYLIDFAKAVLSPGAVVKGYSKSSHYKTKLGAVSNAWDKGHTAMRTHPVDHAFHMFLDTTPTPAARNYLKYKSGSVSIKKFNLPDKYVVVSIGATAIPKELNSTTIDEICKYIIKKGYTPVFLGKNEIKTGLGEQKSDVKIATIDLNLGIDLVEKTNLMEAAEIISGAKTIVGMEGGLTHLAGFTDVPIVAGYTFVSPEVMSPIRANKQGWNVFPVVPPESLECRYCQSNWPLFFDHDFRFCHYGDYVCRDLHPLQFILELEKIL